MEIIYEILNDYIKTTSNKRQKQIKHLKDNGKVNHIEAKRLQVKQLENDEETACRIKKSLRLIFSELQTMESHLENF